MDINILKQISEIKSEIKDISAIGKHGLVYWDENQVINKICEKLIDVEAQLKILELYINNDYESRGGN